MKTIFVFNDSRPTDSFHLVLALCEDGRYAALVKFTDSTMPHCRYAMGVEHETGAVGSICDAVNRTRADVLAAYDIVCGRGEWFPVWLAAPRHDAACREAIRLLRERMVPRTVELGPASIASILAAVLGSSDVDLDIGAASVTPQTTH